MRDSIGFRSRAGICTSTGASLRGGNEPTWARLYAGLLAGFSQPKIELHQGREAVLRCFVVRSCNWTHGSVYQVIGRT